MSEPFRDRGDPLGDLDDHERRIAILEKQVVNSGTIPGTPSLIQGRLAVWNRSGTPTDGLVSVPFYPADAANLLGVYASCAKDGLPTATARFDVRKNGVSIFTSTFPTIVTGQSLGLEVTPSVSFWLSRDEIEIVCTTMSGLSDPKVYIRLG